MSAPDYLGIYAEGWKNRNAEQTIKAVADCYTFDDPNTGITSKNEFADYFAGMKETVSLIRGGILPETFMQFSELVTADKEGMLTAWCWWAIPGTDIMGSGLIKADSEGVRSEVITHYMRFQG